MVKTNLFFAVRIQCDVNQLVLARKIHVFFLLITIMTNQSGEYNCPRASPLVYDHKSLSTVVYLLRELQHTS